MERVLRIWHIEEREASQSNFFFEKKELEIHSSRYKMKVLEEEKGQKKRRWQRQEKEETQEEEEEGGLSEVYH